MNPAARVQAAIDILDQVIVAARDNGAPADKIITDWFRTRRFAGSDDRRAVRELVYRAVRAHGTPPESGRSGFAALASEDPALAALFDGSQYGPEALWPEERVAPDPSLPDWLKHAFSSTLSEADHGSMQGRAPLDLRVNTLKLTRAAALEQLEGAESIAFTKAGIRMEQDRAMDQHPLYREGAVEVQDAGSQIIAETCAAQPGMTVIDLCAGAGGKTLALAAEMAGQGRLIACDTARDRLQQLGPRARRAGLTLVQEVLLNPGREMEALAALRDQADVVLIDAPCSGTGTWRRNPEARWRQTPARLAALGELQARLLDLGSALVKPGGHLVYAVCSLLASEGEAQIDAFLGRCVDWSAPDEPRRLGRAAGAGFILTPDHDGTDGFFIARLAKAC